MKPKPYIIQSSKFVEKCVCRINYGDKYVIAKLKHLNQGLDRIENALNAYIRGGKNNPNGLYCHLFDYVNSHPGGKFKVNVLLESENGYELLKKEQMELDLGRKDPNFLNNQIEAYIPERDPDTEMYGWLTTNEVLNFKKWLKGRSKRSSG